MRRFSFVTIISQRLSLQKPHEVGAADEARKIEVELAIYYEIFRNGNAP
jgi:hypothetical protein